MKNDYLLKEYELCFEQLRFYDNRHGTILQYLFSLTAAVATAQFAVYKFLAGPTRGFFACQAFLSGIVFIATLILFLTMLQNRLYFVHMARQLNAIRGYLMTTEASDFHGNQLYTSTDFPAIKASSVHTFQLLGAALISSLFAGASAYAIAPSIGTSPCLGTAILVAVVVAIGEIWGGIRYLSDSGRETSDEAVHGIKKNNQPEQGAAQDGESAALHPRQ
ncbi:MAG: hypothetical protein WC560_11015 [Syntrophales bacterium]